ncbi:phosphoribosyltransferase [Cyanobium sp. Morenito 9A2]|uniref:phosphoribosyltransferase n=1 Tax=Cyanobium sp. Morenito 9A2 TaxID=2823718 RepID=UPI0020CBCC5C|nr:phosphoribosyltransferase family protein [Cyanobium sp. Morenito 9A2]MCP9848343.1 phosphoribosyltransferase [Cyanobium sp. Morenito 9A2]
MDSRRALWSDRASAGRALALRLGAWSDHPEAVVVGLPRGGMAVAAEVARALDLPLEPWAVRKIGHPLNPEWAIGAVAPGGVLLWDPCARSDLALAPSLELALVGEERRELERRQRVFGDPPAAALQGRPLIVVDDGVATGLSVRAALQALARLGPGRLILAVPVIDAALAKDLAPLVDELVALARVRDLRAVGEHYRQFEQLSDADVHRVLETAGRLQRPRALPP